MLRGHLRVRTFNFDLADCVDEAFALLRRSYVGPGVGEEVSSDDGCLELKDAVSGSTRFLVNGENISVMVSYDAGFGGTEYAKGVEMVCGDNLAVNGQIRDFVDYLDTHANREKYS